MPWFDWSQDDLPCVFSRERTRSNQIFLQRVFRDFPLAFARPESRNGHLQRLWHGNGAGDYIEINWLAEDLQLLQGKPGFFEIVRDLADMRLCLPTWHALHTAALFERARPAAVLELVVAGSSEVPDFIVDLEGARIPVEAKLLMQSDGEAAFYSLGERLIAELKGAEHGLPEAALTLIVIKSQAADCDLRALVRFCESQLARYAGVLMEVRSNACNLFVEPMSPPPGLANYRAVWVMTPVPETESLRVLQRARKASRQLRAFPATRNSGIMAIGLGHIHRGGEIFQHIDARVRAGRLSGIAAVLLSKRGPCFDPPIRTTVDILEVKTSPNATHPILGSVPLRPFANGVRMSEAEQSTGGIYAWRCGYVEGTPIDQTGTELRLPDLRTLTPEMLAD
jgi:hypothetical protein